MRPGRVRIVGPIATLRARRAPLKRCQHKKFDKTPRWRALPRGASKAKAQGQCTTVPLVHTRDPREVSKQA